jgi:hypothetical protein
MPEGMAITQPHAELVLSCPGAKHQVNGSDTVSGTHKDEKAEYSANQLVDDLEEHPASQPSPPPGRR